MFGSNKKKQTGSPTIPNNTGMEEEPIPTVDFNQIDKLLNSDIRDDDIQLTDADLEDPELLAQLSQIEGDGIPKPTPKPLPHPVSKTVTATTTTTVKKAAATPQPKVKTEEDELRDLMDFDNDTNDINKEEDIIDHKLIKNLEERLIFYRKWAVYSNQQGDRAESLKYMKASKLIESALENLKEGLPVETSTLPPHLPLPPQSQSQQPQPQQPQTPQRVATSTPTSPKPLPSPPTPQRVVNKPPPIQSPKIEILSKETIEAEERIQTWDLIEEDFRRKHYNLTSEAVRLRDIDKITAIHLLKESKGVHAIIDQININRKLGLNPPPFHFDEKTTSTEISFPDIKENEMVIKISDGVDLSKALHGDFTISGEIPYPSPETPTKFQSNSIGLNDPNFSYTSKVQIERKKTLQRCLEKKKMTLVFYSTKMFFMKSVVGKCEVRMADLLTKCEFNEKVPILKDGSKKETGSFINVNIRMRTPLLQKEMKVVKERVLVLDSPITIDKSPQPSQPQPQPPQPQQTQEQQQPQQTTTITTKSSETITTKPDNPTTSTTTSPTVTTTTVTAPSQEKPAEKPSDKPAEKSTANDNDKTDDEEVDDLDKVVSNDVLEMILETTKQQLASQGPKQDLLDRKQAVELKLMILETNVSAGILTMDAYMEQLQKATANDIKLAIELKKKGRQDLAVKLMQRVSIMKKEMEGGDE
ncbi:hypothetical protein DICPUDRAFT_99916 [Dictyostelium purpureum]|uniref:DM14 domain-containing protein n=1 Tax=Dictyostelium purpureum TaxID=5786 RepID=F1A3R0_DICPU|nr:uncharacterized protein DICPUDRAFT_99916 [Dictyostelium purpureum]EGC29169.1 hypothetical protein DICPUDRAFT_99916 [Dictyostelium purpureum]|eukprot:XP_003294304.1 hypothetical protein DICPUDRAFT_99916 [Dictyostelium purpureum]